MRFKLHIPDGYEALVAFPIAIAVIAVLTAKFVLWAADQIPIPTPPTVEWRDEVQDYDTSGPDVPLGEEPIAPPGWTCHEESLGTTRCTKDAPPEAPEPEPNEVGSWGHGPPRVYRECVTDDECPESSPHCTEQGRCAECATSTQCPGAQLCKEHHCADPGSTASHLPWHGVDGRHFWVGVPYMYGEIRIDP